MIYFVASLVKTLIAPMHLLCILLVLGGYGAVSHNERWQYWGSRICFVLANALLLIAILPIDNWVLGPLENKFGAADIEKVDGIILLGGDENPGMMESRKQASVHYSSRRYITFAGLARQYPKARLVYTGGNPSLGVKMRLTNADVAKALLKATGVDTERVVFEDKSMNTYENAMFAAEMVKPRKEENWLLVTSAAHMPRALLTFRKAGWSVHPYPTGYVTTKSTSYAIGFHLMRSLGALDTAVYEYGGLLAYWIMGRIDRPWK